MMKVWIPLKKILASAGHWDWDGERVGYHSQELDIHLFKSPLLSSSSSSTKTNKPECFSEGLDWAGTEDLDLD